jgi:4-amino-4-deoxy-L-arabinose transferase-like glycosyltransferase
MNRAYAALRRARGVVAAGAAGLVVRLAWAAYAARPPQGLHDPARYLAYGQSLASGDGYRDPFSHQFTAYYPPGYPWFVGGVTWLTRHVVPIGVPKAVAVVQALLALVIIACTAFIAARVAGRRAAVVAAWLVALWPSLVLYGTAVLSETLCTALLLAAIAVLVRCPWDRAVRRADLIAFGLLLGTGALVRPQIVVVLVAAAATWWLASRDWRAAARSFGIVAVVLVVVLVPWFVRNQNRLGLFVLSTNTADDLCIGHNDQANGGFLLLEQCAQESPAQGRAAEVHHYHQNLSDAISWALHHPVREVQLVPERAWHLLSDDGDALRDTQSYGDDDFIDGRIVSALGALSNAWYATVIVFGVAGAAMLADRRRPQGLFVVLAAASILVLPLAFFGDPRFKVPALPLVAVIAAVPLSRVLSRRDRVSSR